MPRQIHSGSSQSRQVGARTARLLCLATLLASLLSACTGHAQKPKIENQGRSTLVLVSLDGFRWDFMELAETPSLDELAASGVQAERLIPVFPTKTFPNHYTIVTGLYPDRHGVVANYFYDPSLDASFSLSDPQANTRADWWEGEPIWATAERQGLTTATYFWPGSEAEYEGFRPTHWRPYDHDQPYDERIDQVLSWLDVNEVRRPDFIALYLDLVDTITHSHDPDTSPRVAEAVRTVDAVVGRLLDGLRASGQWDRVNLIIVSDHGMAATSQERVIFLDDYLDTDGVRIADWNPVLSLWPEPNQEARIYQALADAHPHLRVFRRADIPADWHYRDHRRVPPILAVADEGWSITTRAEFDRNPASFDGANHGYEPSLTSMGALFLAHGPAFEKDLIVPPLEAVDLYELMCRILRLEPAPNDGDLRQIQHILRH